MSWRSLSATAGAALVALTLNASQGEAQRWRGRNAWPEPKFTVEVYGGIASFGEFLEQYAIDIDDEDIVLFDGIIGQRELRAGNAFTLGAAIAYRVWDKTDARLGFTWAHSELKYEDDTGLNLDFLDDDDLADFNVYVLSLEVLRFIFDHTCRLNPYLVAGINGAWWHLDDVVNFVVGVGFPRDGFVTSDQTQFRFGGSAGLGLQYRISPQFSARLEVDAFGLGNPFDGENAWVPVTGVTFDEPSHVAMGRYTLHVTYSFGRRR
jgi:opacity protein-like surface antigen